MCPFLEILSHTAIYVLWFTYLNAFIYYVFYCVFLFSYFKNHLINHYVYTFTVNLKTYHVDLILLLWNTNGPSLTSWLLYLSFQFRTAAVLFSTGLSLSPCAFQISTFCSVNTLLTVWIYWSWEAQLMPAYWVQSVSSSWTAVCWPEQHSALVCSFTQRDCHSVMSNASDSTFSLQKTNVRLHKLWVIHYVGGKSDNSTSRKPLESCCKHIWSPLSSKTRCIHLWLYTSVKWYHVSKKLLVQNLTLTADGFKKFSFLMSKSVIASLKISCITVSNIENNKMPNIVRAYCVLRSEKSVLMSAGEQPTGTNYFRADDMMTGWSDIQAKIQ